jgi:hypothetical protein
MMHPSVFERWATFDHMGDHLDGSHSNHTTKPA